MKAFFAGKFFYQLYFQTPGVAEAEFEKDIRTALRKFYHLASGEMDVNILAEKSEHDDLLTSLIDPERMGPWLSDTDLDFYVNEFTRSGFFGPLNYYRNHNETWGLSADKPTEIHQPALFVAGERDGVIAMAGPALENMPNFVRDLRTNVLIPKIGHWTQQEAPEAVNGYLLNWLAELD
jgi:pimeloyl-ACP methyl ester carboxylesterase